MILHNQVFSTCLDLRRQNSNHSKSRLGVTTTPADTDKVISAGSMQPSTIIHAGFSHASEYDAHRPSYPPEAVDALLSHMGLAERSHARILDLGAGTGKFTALLAERPENFEVLAVEPHMGMRAELEAKRLQNVTLVEGHAADLGGIEDGAVDGVIVAQVRGRVRTRGRTPLTSAVRRLFTGTHAPWTLDAGRWE